MQTARTLAVLSAVAMLLATACSSSGSDSPPPIPFPSGEGIKQNLSLSTLRADGWTVCLDDPYDTDGPTISTLLTLCPGEHLLLACTSGLTNDVLALAAADRRSVVTQADAATSTAHHVSGTVGWYFNDSLSWGFFPAGQGLNRLPCDYDAAETASAQRLCWHTSGGDVTPGYRCGTDVNLNSSSTWRRLVLAHP